MGTEHPIACSDCGETAESFQTRGEERLCPACAREDAHGREQKEGLLKRIRRKNRGFLDAGQSDPNQDDDL